MADSHVSIRWVGEGLRFETPHPSHNVFRIDGDGATAHSPVQALLLSLAGCTAADVIEILTRMRVTITSLEVVVEGNRNPEPPRYFKSIRMVYQARGVDQQNRSKLERAVALSQEKYCSVMHSLRPDIEFTCDVVID